MIPRRAFATGVDALERQAAVALIGPRQVGKTTLALAGHPIVGLSWEGFVIENLIAAASSQTRFSFYRTSAGAEVDLLLEMPAGELWAVEIKRGPAPALERGFHNARANLKPARSFIVYSGQERYPLAEGVEVICLHEISQMLSSVRAVRLSARM